MHYSASNLSIQLSLISLIVVVGVGFLVRTVILFHRESAGTRPLYPHGWNAAQCRALEQLLIGLGLVALWATYLFFVPWMTWPLGYLEMISLISILSASYAWTVLLGARNWTRFDAIPRSFLAITAFLLLWWGTAFAAIGWVLKAASTPPTFHIYSASAFAELVVPRLVQLA